MLDETWPWVSMSIDVIDRAILLNKVLIKTFCTYCLFPFTLPVNPGVQMQKGGVFFKAWLSICPQASPGEFLRKEWITGF